MTRFRAGLLLAALGAVLAAVLSCVGDDPQPTTPPNITINNYNDGSAPPPSGTSSSSSSSSGSTEAGPHVVYCSNGGLCNVPDQVCCVEADAASTAVCKPRNECNAASRMACDSIDDCPAGQLCCGTAANGMLWSSSCTPPAEDGACAERPLCRDTVDCPRDAGTGACGDPTPDFFPPGYKVCF